MNLLIGKNIKYLRRIKNITQDDLADIVGVKKTTISSYELDRSNPSVDVLIKIAGTLEVSLDDLCYTDIAKKNKAGTNTIDNNNTLSETENLLKVIAKDWEETIAMIEDLQKRVRKLEGNSD